MRYGYYNQQPRLSDAAKAELVPQWTASDETDLRRKVADLWRGRCWRCEEEDHAHARVRIGPYLICRCLRCPDVTVGVAS